MAEALANVPAVLPDVPALEDKLNFGPYVWTLRDIILSPDTLTPLTIGIFGSWGSGKTSLMKMLEEALKTSDRREGQGRQTFSVWFNAWLYSKEDALWRALIVQVLSGLRRIRDLDEAARSDLNELAEQLYRAVGPSELGTLSIAAAELLKEEGTSAAQITLALQSGLDLLENVALARQQTDLAAAKALHDHVRRATAQLEQERIESLERFQEQFKTMVKKYVLPRGYMVIFVDDLDRCLPDKAVEVLEAIKLFLDVPGCIFVLGIDRDVVKRGIRLRYGEMGGMGRSGMLPLLVSDALLEEGSGGAAKYRAFMQGLLEESEDVIDGGRYLEKIIQIPFVLPPISPEAMGSFVADLTPNLPDPRCGLVFVRGLEPNPRQVKRSLNIFALLWGLSQNQPYLADRISPVRLAKLVVLQQRHSELYEKLRENPALIIAWERAFRVRRDRAGFLSWARGSERWSDQELATLESEIERSVDLPDDLSLYEDLDALQDLLVMHPLAGDEAEGTNFVDMTPESVRELIFLAYTSEGRAERPEPKVPVEAYQEVKGFEELAVDLDDVVPLHQMLSLSGEEAGFMARRALGTAADAMKRYPSDVAVVKQLAEAGRNLAAGLMGKWKILAEMPVLEGDSRTVQAFFSGPEGTTLIHLPWEMVYDRDKALPLDLPLEEIALEDFWGGRHIIERPLALIERSALGSELVGRLPERILSPMSDDGVPRVGLVLDWGIDAGPAQEMFADLADSDRVRVNLIEEPEALRQSLMENLAEIYVFYGRGWQEYGESVVGIGKGYPLMAKELRDWRGPLRKSTLKGRGAQILFGRDPLTPLFYFCLQGDSYQEVGWSAWLSALQSFDAGGVIAPLIYTSGEWPLQLVQLFFTGFLDGEPVGEALRDARLELFEGSRNPFGLLYAHFGAPTLRLGTPEAALETETD